MSRRLDDLSPAMRPLAIELIARCVEAGIMVMIIDTLRTPAEHAENLRRGVSWTARSKHLTGDAIDLCLYDTYQLHGPDKLQWSTSAAAWQTIGRIGEAIGLEWGGRWTVKDMGHFELAAPPSDERRA